MTIQQHFALPGCGCDRRDTQKTLISIDEALHHIVATTPCVEESEQIALGHAFGRILSCPVRSVSVAPPFDNAAMDGYAIMTSALTGSGPWTLPVVARVPAGQSGPARLSGLSVARILTGAPIPEGVDAVVMQEDVQRNDMTIRIARRPEPELNIRRAGSDIAAGEVVLDAGRRLGPREIALCAAAGIGAVHVRRRIRVAILVTGDEVRQTGTNRGSAEIWDVNTPMLTAALARPGIDLVAVAHGSDNRDQLVGQLAQMSRLADLVITTGGISVGEEDHVKPALQAMGADITFSGVAVKPGKPVSFGYVGRTPWLGLPGNPLSALVTWQLFGTTLIRQLAGETGTGGRRRHVVTARDISRKAGRCELRPATFNGLDAQGRDIVTFETATHSGRLRNLADVDGLIFVPADAEFLPAGALVEFQPFCQS